MKEIIAQKYLPSKKIRIIFLVLFVIVCVASVFIFISSKKEKVSLNTNSALQIENQTIADLIESDLDKDSIPDWEERLWGTDKNNKNTFGVSDLEYVQNKKNELKIEDSIDDKILTETEKFAREFFTTYSAIKASGANGDTINNFGSVLGDKIGDPTLEDIYDQSDIKIKNPDNEQTQEDYYNNLKNLFEKYEAMGLGDEISIIGNEFSTTPVSGGVAQNEALLDIAQTYKDFSLGVINTPAPQSLASFGVKIANSANNTGISIVNMTKMIKDPIVGISGVSQYQKYSDELVDIVASLENFVFGAGKYVENDGTIYPDDTYQTEEDIIEEE